MHFMLPNLFIKRLKNLTLSFTMRTEVYTGTSFGEFIQ